METDVNGFIVEELKILEDAISILRDKIPELRGKLKHSLFEKEVPGRLAENDQPEVAKLCSLAVRIKESRINVESFNQALYAILAECQL